MRAYSFGILLLLLLGTTVALSQRVAVEYDDANTTLVVDGKPMMINGMNWDYFPIGTNYNYSLWSQSDDIIIAALDSEMSLLKGMGINAIRQYTGIPPRWITYIYERYGIYTMLNHSFGRYGLTLNGTWVANTEYSDKRVKSLLLSEVEALAQTYKDTPGLLMYLLGNENNYGLFWDGAATENIPIEKRQSTIRAKHMYALFNDAAKLMKGIDSNHPVAMCNGDLMFLDIIQSTCQDVDIFGTNMYRGASFTDAFERVKTTLNKPILFTEFGSDAYNAKQNSEDQTAQANYLLTNWKEIYANASGMGVGNSIGGFTFQFSDGWWKHGQTINLDVHDNTASWANDAYPHDFVKGDNNMNEEWFGICAKGEPSEDGLYALYPRSAYYTLKQIHQFDPMLEGVTEAAVDNYFATVSIGDAAMQARADKAALASQSGSKIRLNGFRAEMTTFNTGGTKLTTPDVADPNESVYPNELGFDHMESFYFDVEAKPSDNIRATVSFNVLGNVAENPIDEIFYENRGRSLEVNTVQGNNATLSAEERLKIYSASVTWSDKWFDLNGFYRTGHYHWGYEGDFFGLYPEANYGENLDIYNGIAPIGFEVHAKKQLKGLKVAFGPQLWWGANPAVLAKYERQLGKVSLAAIYHEDIDSGGEAVSSIAIPTQQNRRASLYAKTSIAGVGVELGGLWSGQPRVGDIFQVMKSGETTVYQDEVIASDTWGGKFKLTYSNGPINWYGQGAAKGIVADGGADYTQTYTGWRLKESGSGNQYNLLSGFTFTKGNFQFAPNFLWQRPLIGPMPNDALAPGRLRNILDDPFAVRSNRKTTAGEFLITYDPTPGTWMYQWDNDKAEDAKFAANLGVVFRHLSTSQDAAIGILGDGRTSFAFDGATPAADLWEVHSKIVSKLNKEFGVIANIYAGNAQSNGDDQRTIERIGGDVDLIYKKMRVKGMVKVNDWGPYDYHRDFNLTFPLQLKLDVSTAAFSPKWLDTPATKLGAQMTWRALDHNSPRYCPVKIVDATGESTCDETATGYDNGSEWEFRTYLHIYMK